MRLFFVIIRRMRNFILILVLGAVTVGCAHLQEITKSVWGSSTKALEDARVSAATGMYACFPGACFNEILKLAKAQDYDIFIQDRKRYLIVVVGTRPMRAIDTGELLSAQDTTEVGIFITGLQLKESKIEVVSLSSSAQQRVADIIFHRLDQLFPQIKEIPLL